MANQSIEPAKPRYDALSTLDITTLGFKRRPAGLHDQSIIALASCVTGELHNRVQRLLPLWRIFHLEISREAFLLAVPIATMYDTSSSDLRCSRIVAKRYCTNAMSVILEFRTAL